MYVITNKCIINNHVVKQLLWIRIFVYIMFKGTI